jgi:chromosome segregation ATPase
VRFRVSRAEGELRALQRQLKEMSSRMESSKKEIGVLNELNRGLMNNQAVYKDKLSVLEATHKEKDSTIAVCRRAHCMHAVV